MIVELVNTGSELMLGRVLNTHQQWICRRMADLGYPVTRQVAVPDTGPDIVNAVRESLARAEIVITTGGLGPTSDDLTRDLVAELLGRTLHEDPSIVAHIEQFFASRNRRMPEKTRVQALVPAGAIILPNPHGTAPGLAIEVRPNSFRADGGRSWLLMLPGPPRELRPMFHAEVEPLLRREFPLQNAYVCRTLRTTGIGESLVQARIGQALEPLVIAGLELGYCARPGQVDVRLSAGGPEGGKLVAEAEGIVEKALRRWIYGQEGDELESAIIRMLTQRGKTLALAESCTGGRIASLLTDVAGASAVLVAGIVAYSNAAKQHFLGVNAATLAEHGAVSEPVAREMAQGALRETGADYALSVTGIAGPTGGSPEKPVGTVFIGLAGPFETKVERHLNDFDRETFKQVTAQQGLDLLRRTVAGAVSDTADPK